MKKIIIFCLIFIFTIGCSRDYKGDLNIPQETLPFKSSELSEKESEEPKAITNENELFVGTGQKRDIKNIDYTYYSIELSFPRENIREATTEEIDVNGTKIKFLLGDPIIYDINNVDLDETICELFNNKVIKALDEEVDQYAKLVEMKSFKELSIIRTFNEINGYVFLKATNSIINYKKDVFNDTVEKLKTLLTLTDIDYMYKKLGLIKNIEPSQIYDYFIENEAGMITKANEAKDLINKLNKYHNLEITQIPSVFVYYDLYEQEELLLSDLFFNGELISEIVMKLDENNKIDINDISEKNIGFSINRYSTNLFFYDDKKNIETTIEIEPRNFFDYSVVGYKRTELAKKSSIPRGEWFFEKNSNLKIKVDSIEIYNGYVEGKKIKIFGVDLTPLNGISVDICNNLEVKINNYLLSFLKDSSFHDLIMTKEGYAKLDGLFNDSIIFGLKEQSSIDGNDSWCIIDNWIHALPIYVNSYKMNDFLFESLTGVAFDGTKYLRDGANIDEAIENGEYFANEGDRNYSENESYIVQIPYNIEYGYVNTSNALLYFVDNNARLLRSYKSFTIIGQYDMYKILEKSNKLP